VEKIKGTGPLAICLTLYMMIELGGTVSGSAYNPMIGVVLNIFGFIIKIQYYPRKGAPEEQIQFVWIYMLGPMAGAFLAAMFNSFCSRFKN